MRLPSPEPSLPMAYSSGSRGGSSRGGGGGGSGRGGGGGSSNAIAYVIAIVVVLGVVGLVVALGGKKDAPPPPPPPPKKVDPPVVKPTKPGEPQYPAMPPEKFAEAKTLVDSFEADASKAKALIAESQKVRGKGDDAGWQ